MKIHTTNYINTFIEIAEDSPVDFGEVPPVKDEKSIARMQYEILEKHPYKYTSDDVLFMVFAQRNDLTKSELKEAREKFFSKGQPCFRSSPLTKRYGWGIHNDKDGKIAMYGSETKEYKKYCSDKKLPCVKAMRSKRA
ncbi:MAG: hypothetical protein K0S32_291 [Bacteroidetes bacterium]|jgi:hypothetical protein|nr:hypothetical protein [Bacteroidota bacterium]